MPNKDKSWTEDTLNRVLRAVFDNTNKEQKELARILGLSGAAISHAKMRYGGFEKHRGGIARWMGITIQQLEELEKASLDEGFGERVARLVGAKTHRTAHICKHSMLVPLSAKSLDFAGKGRLALLSLSQPNDGDLVCFEAEDGWHIGAFYRTGETIVVVEGPYERKKAHSWPLKEAPACHPLLMIGERPILRGPVN